MEGPSVHLLANKLKALIKQKIIQVYGNSKINKNALLNQNIKDIYSFGKRLIIQLNDYALIIHFLMYGTYSIDLPKPFITPRLALIATKDSFFIYNCSIRMLKKSNIKKFIPLDLDILSDGWDLNKIVSIVKSYPNQTIDDILLNQSIFPGVGNIIKNEALFLSNILPKRKISKLSIKQLKTIILYTRLFSKKFLELIKIFKLKKNLQIYQKTKCLTCNNKIIREKTGQKKRLSFFCPNCQK